MEENPAAAPATGTEENLNTNQEAPAAPTANIPAEQIEAFNKFVAGQGGFDNAFTKWKELVSKPQPKDEEKTAETPAQQQPVQPQQPIQQKPAEGFLSANDIMALQYRNMLAGDEKYSKIKDYVNSDGWLKDMRAMGMSPTDAQGNLNDRVIRQFLDLKAQTVPANTPSDPITTTPTVEYVNVGDSVNTVEDAFKVIQQNIQLKAMGKPEHPKTKDAKDKISQYYASRKK